MLSVCGSWDNPAWDELDWARVKDLQVRDIFVEREKAAAIAQNRVSVTCEQFLKHVCPEWTWTWTW